MQLSCRRSFPRTFGLRKQVASSYQDPSIVPRPGGLLLANGILFAAVSLFVGGTSMASLLEWRFCTGAIAIFVGVPGLTLGCLQYSAIFGRNAYSAATLAVVLFAAAALFIWASVAAEAPFAALTGLWFALTAVGAIRWRRQLLAAWRTPPADAGDLAPAAASERQWPVVSAPTRLGWARPLAALLVALAGAACGYRAIPPREARHVSPSAAHLDLPTGATDVCVLHSAMRGPVLYDFATDEASFLEWLKVRPEPVEMQPVTRSVTVSRLADEYDGSVDHVIDHGWYHTQRSRHDGTDYVDYAFDADNGRGYFCSDSD
jgi:hypothetical protein